MSIETGSDRTVGNCSADAGNGSETSGSSPDLKSSSPVSGLGKLGVVAGRLGRMQRVRGQAITGVVVAAVTLYVARVDPNEPGHYPLCPLKWATGLDCPACGGLRATYAITHGDFGAAAGHNVLALVVLPALASWWAVLMWRGWTGAQVVATPASARRKQLVISVAIAAAALFTVVRNLPFVPFLDSAAG